MKHHSIEGGGGLSLHAVDAGNPAGRPILFIHGFSQCWLSWSRQLASNLAEDYRLVALDMRGHGLSGKPRDAYGDPRLWADDIDAVIRSLRLDNPILCGWSYGPLVILDYIRHHGEDDIGGIHLVGAVTGLGTEKVLAVLSPAFLALVPGFFASDVEQSARSLEALLRLCVVNEPSAEDVYLTLGFSLSVPPWVRQGLFSRSFDNDDLLPKIRKPVLITHGTKDAVVNPVVVEEHKAAMPHAQIHLMEDLGHAPFWDDARAFNDRLRAFAEAL
jgi:pimeloyl-ACP methyl ester carboxylesterase